MTVAANRHKFHVHTGSGVDRNNCDTAAGHFDPAGLEVNGYSCDAASPQQCYAGDLSGKLGKLGRRKLLPSGLHSSKCQQ